MKLLVKEANNSLNRTPELLHALKEAGKIRQEGKQYVGQDGDIMLFKFNV